MKFKESELAHKYLDPLSRDGYGVEIGGSAHNSFGIANCKNLDFTDDMTTIYKLEEIKLCNEALPVDIIALGDDTGLPDNEVNYVLNSHVFEHQCNPIKTLLEWYRITKSGGIIYSVVPLRDANPLDALRPVSTLNQMIWSYETNQTTETHPIEEGHAIYGHYYVYTLDVFIDLVVYVNSIIGERNSGRLEVIDTLDRDDKVFNGFVVVLKVNK